jgi:hypothetical protein
MTPTTDTTLEILKQDRMGRVRTPRARQEAILEEDDRSGMTGQQFSHYLGIKYQTLATWIQKRRKRQAGRSAVAASPVRWVEAEVGEDKDRHIGKAGLVVELGARTILRVADERAAKLAAPLLGHLGVGRC